MDDALKLILQALVRSGGVELIEGTLGQILRQLLASDTTLVFRDAEVAALKQKIAELEAPNAALTAELPDAERIVEDVEKELQWHH